MPPQQKSGSGSGSGGGQDSSMTMLWVIFLLFVVAYFIWRLLKNYIIATIFFINLWQAKLVALFVNSPELQDDIYLMQTLDPTSIEWAQFLQLLSSVGDYIRYPIGAILLLLGLWLYKKNLVNRFCRAHTMNTLRKQEQFNWPAIMPVVPQDLTELDLSEGPWAMALTPYEFAKKHRLLKKEDVLRDSTGTPGLEMTASVKKADAKRVFTLQLGPYWEGFERCPPHVSALAAVFLARIKRDRPSATLILETLDKSFILGGKPNFAIARPILKKYQNSPDIQEIIEKHAYLLTVMASLVEAARLDGVVPTSEFLWLKTIDRRLWYMLNSVGRQTPFAEVGGPFAHWRAEKSLGRRSLMPMIDEATKALEIAIKEIKLTPKALQELR